MRNESIEKLEFYDAEFREAYGGEFNLGVTPSDINNIFKSLNYSSYSGKDKESNQRVHPVALFNFLISPGNVLNDQQSYALNHVGFEAEQYLKAPGELLALGYRLYLKVAQNMDKVMGPFPYDFKQMIDMSVFGPDPNRGLFELETLAKEKVTLLAGIAVDYLPVFTSSLGDKKQDTYIYYDDEDLPRMLLAGIGLAYSHCYALMQDCSAELESMLS